MSRIRQLRHPLIGHHVTTLRDCRTAAAEFRLVVQRLAGLLAYEATADLQTVTRTVQTPLSEAAGHRVEDRIAVVPILRAGLGMVAPVVDLLPQAEVWHLGLYRDEATAKPVEYYSKLPHGDPVDVALILDPMLATGGSAGLAVAAVRDWGVRRIKLCSIIAAEPGIQAVCETCPDLEVYVCAIDAELNAEKFIVPGLGDAGDRIFNTRPAP